MTLKVSRPSLTGAKSVEELADRLQLHLDEMRRRIPNFQFVPFTELSMSADQTFSSGAASAKVEFDTAETDNTLGETGSVGQFDSDDDRIQPVQGGLHLFSAGITWSGAIQSMTLELRKNGTAIKSTPGFSLCVPVDVTLFDYFEVYVTQTSSGSASRDALSASSYFTVLKIR